MEDKHPKSKGGSWTYIGDQEGNLKSHICNECGEDIIETVGVNNGYTEGDNCNNRI